MAALAETLPLGNEWKFGRSNFLYHLKADVRLREITKPEGLLAEVVQQVSAAYVTEGWQFASVVADEQGLAEKGIMPSLTVIFSHPDRIQLEENIGVALLNKFLRKEVLGGAKDTIDASFRGHFPAEDPIHHLLRRGHFLAQFFEAEYNILRIGSNMYLQPGVGTFKIEMCTTESEVTKLEGQVDNLNDQISALEEAKKPLVALRNSKPEPLLS